MGSYRYFPYANKGFVSQENKRDTAIYMYVHQMHSMIRRTDTMGYQGGLPQPLQRAHLEAVMLRSLRNVINKELGDFEYPWSLTESRVS